MADDSEDALPEMSDLLEAVAEILGSIDQRLERIEVMLMEECR